MRGGCRYVGDIISDKLYTVYFEIDIMEKSVSFVGDKCVSPSR